MSGVTVIITSYNEEDHIVDAIRSVAWCDEILVVDSNSTDNTVAKIRSEGIEPLIHTYEGPAQQKNWAIPQAKNQRVLLLDADERCTEELKQEIRSLMSKDDMAMAYWIKRRNHFMGKEVKYSGWQGDKVIRFFDRDSCRYSQNRVHEEIECDGPIGTLTHKLIHYTYRGMNHYMEKFDRYTTDSAKDRLPRTGNVTWFHLYLKPLARFFRHYVIKLGFLDGKVGLIISSMSAYSVFLRYLKMDRLKAGEEL